MDDTGLEHHLLHQVELAVDFFWHRLRWQAVQDHLPPGGAFRLLDVGAGTGVLGELVQRDRPEATYLFDEPIPSLAARLEARFGGRANRRDEPSWHDVDVVTLLDVIEHLDDPNELLGAVCSRCRNGTLVVITVPASERLWSQWDVNLGHRRRYSRRALRETLERLPVDVAEISWLFPELVPPALWRALRHRPLDRSDEDGGTPVSEFPGLPRWLNDVLYGLGLGPLRLRRWVPFGTSLFAVARVRR